MSKKLVEIDGKRIFVTSNRDEYQFALSWMASRETLYKYDRDGISFYYSCEWNSWSSPHILTKQEVQERINEWFIDGREKLYTEEYVQDFKERVIQQGFSWKPFTQKEIKVINKERRERFLRS